MTDLLSGPGLAGLITLPGIGIKRATVLATRFRTWDALAAADTADLQDAIGKAAGSALAQARPDTQPHPALPAGVQVISQYDRAYPARLRNIPDPPPLLWVAGTLPGENHPALAIVGTRHPTAYGQAAARSAAKAAVDAGIDLVSGLAVGVDSICSEVAVAAQVPTWVVLGQGVDTVGVNGPRAALAAAILAGGGGLIAEVPPGTPVAAHQLTRRNRLQSGLTDVTFIAQSAVPGPDRPAGTMHTARYAVAQQRLLAVARPGGAYAHEPQSAGNVALTDLTGMDPALVHADDALAAVIAAKRPVADVIVAGREDLSLLVRACVGAYEDRFGPVPMPAPRP